MKSMSPQQLRTTVLSVLQVAAKLLFAALLSRLLPLTEYGVFATFLSVLMIAVVLAQFGLPEIVMRETAVLKAEQPERLRSMWLTSDFLMIPTILLAAVLIIGLSFVPALGNLGWATGLLVAAHLPVMGICALRAAALRGAGRANTAHFLMSVASYMATICILIAAWAAGFEITIFMVFACNLMGISAALAVLHWQRETVSIVSGRTVFSRADRRYLMMQSLPMAGVAGLAIFNSQMDILMLGVLGSPAQAALYQVCIHSMMVLVLIRTQLGYTISADAAQLWRSGDVEAIREICRPAAHLNAIMAVGVFTLVAIFGKSYLVFAFGPEFGEAYLALIIVAGAWLGASFFGMVGPVMVMTGHQKYTLFSSVISALINVVLNLGLVPYLGPVGAAISLLISVVWWNASLWWISRAKLGVDLSLLGRFLPEPVVKASPEGSSAA
jgi:O-antigen/teichoic acid export membrane protein